MREKILLIILILLFSSLLFGQKTDSLKMVDEFGAIALDELMARLDGATNEYHSVLPENPNTKIRVRIYGGITDSFLGAYYSGSTIESYLKNNRKLEPNEFSIDHCNINKEDLRTQIYIASQGENLSACENSLVIPAQTIRFATVYFYNPDFKFVPIEDVAPEFGFSQGDYSRTGFNVLKNFVEKSSENKIYIVSYLQSYFEENDKGKIIRKKIDKISLAAKMLRAAKNELIKNGFDASQIEFIEGGYSKGDQERRVEFYFVPKNGELPLPKPDYFLRRK